MANDVFTPSAETVDHARRTIAAFREAEALGRASVDFEGQHIDIAHVKTAEGIIALAEAAGGSPARNGRVTDPTDREAIADCRRRSARRHAVRRLLPDGG